MDADIRLARIEQQLNEMQQIARVFNTEMLAIIVLLSLILWRVW